MRNGQRQARIGQMKTARIWLRHKLWHAVMWSFIGVLYLSNYLFQSARLNTALDVVLGHSMGDIPSKDDFVKHSLRKLPQGPSKEDNEIASAVNVKKKIYAEVRENHDIERKVKFEPTEKEGQKRKQKEPWQQDVPKTLNKRQDFSACLLVKDDNRRLIEWLAYHYQVLPLRNVVIAVDPDSVRSPRNIVNRWNNSELNMEILLWNDKDFMEKLKLVKRLDEKPLLDKLGVVEQHLERQMLFFSECMLYHKKHGRSWVALVDTDEFIVFNHAHLTDPPESKKNPIRENLPVIGEKTVLDFIQEQSRTGDLFDNPCHRMTRLMFGAKEVGQAKMPFDLGASYFNPKSFDTLRYFYHDKLGNVLGENMLNGWPKVMIDVTRIKDEYFRPPHIHSVHHPIKGVCHSIKGLEYGSSLFRVHHYLGSWEAYSERNDFRRDKSTFFEKASVSNGPTFDTQPWLANFVQSVGDKQAHKLLEGAGEIQWMMTDLKEHDNELCALLIFGLPRQFSKVVFPSMKKYVLDANPSCHIFVHSYNVTQAVEMTGSTHVDVEELQLLQYRSPITLLETEQDFQNQRNVSFFREHFPQPHAKGGWNYPTSIDNMIRQWHSLESIWKLMSEYEDKHQLSFKRVGLFRSDVKYIDPINILTQETGVIPSMMYEPKLWPQAINDRMFYGDRAFAEIWATDRFGSVPSYLAQQQSDDYYSERKGIHSEDFLRYLLLKKWDISSLTVRDICFQRVRAKKIETSDCDFVSKTKEKQEVPGVIVLGMHRSGTSLLTGLIVKGLSYHLPGKQMDPNDQNKRGYFENLNVMQQNDNWLKQQGWTWDRHTMHNLAGYGNVVRGGLKPSCVKEVDCPAVISKKKNFLLPLHSVLPLYNDPKNRLWILKDPRICFTLRDWLRVLEGEPPAVVFTFRNPMEVAVSLSKRKRNKVESITDGLKLWIWYNRMAIENSKNLCRVVTSNEAIVRDPVAETSRIASNLQKKCGLRHQELNKEAIESFFDPELMHEQSQSDPVNHDDMNKERQNDSFFLSDLDETAKKEALEVYQKAMRVFGDLKNGDAFNKDYLWPAFHENTFEKHH